MFTGDPAQGGNPLNPILPSKYPTITIRHFSFLGLTDFFVSLHDQGSHMLIKHLKVTQYYCPEFRNSLLTCPETAATDTPIQVTCMYHTVILRRVEKYGLFEHVREFCSVVNLIIRNKCSGFTAFPALEFSALERRQLRASNGIRMMPERNNF